MHYLYLHLASAFLEGSSLYYLCLFRLLKNLLEELDLVLNIYELKLSLKRTVI